MLSPQVRQEPNLDHGELRDGFSASTFGPREIPQYRHEDEEQSVVFGRNDPDDYLLMISFLVMRLKAKELSQFPPV
jgi:hypothetical protein